MSFESETNAKLAQLTNAISEFSTSSKRIEDLDDMATLDTTYKVHVSKGNDSKKLDLSKIVIDGGLMEWSAQIYKKRLAVVSDKKIYILTNTATLPYNSTNFTTELNAGIWEEISFQDLNVTGIISASVTLTNDDHNGKILFITNDVNITLQTTLHPSFNCILKMREEDDFTANILADTGATLSPATPILKKGKSCSIVRFLNSNQFVISGEI